MGECARHPGRGLGQLGFVVVGEPEPEERQRAAGEVEHPRAPEEDSQRLAGAFPGSEVDTLRHPGPERHPALRDAEAQGVTERPTKRLGQRVATARVDLAHPAHMTDELAILEELGDRAFDRGVALQVADGPQAHQPVQHRRRRNHVADAQSRSEDLGERTEVENVVGAGPCRDGGKGLASIVELVVVVVLDDREAMPVRASAAQTPPVAPRSSPMFVVGNWWCGVT